MTSNQTDHSVSRRTALSGIGAASLGLALAARTQGAAAQAVSTQGHPLVGTWFLDLAINDPLNALEGFVLNADGTYVEANSDGSVRVGAWEATGPTSANLTILGYTKKEDGSNAGALKVRVAIELGDDHNTYDAQFTIEPIGPDGSSAGQAGPGRSSASRLAVEGPGTPSMTLDQLFGAPAATPSS